MIHLDEKNTALLKKILKVFAPEGRKIMAFGSRVTGIRLKPHSDIDLCIMGETPIDSRALSDLKDALSNSNLSVRVDVVDWASASPSFRKMIEDQLEEIQL
jgi:predicted nucleotidyltransferase